MAFDPIPLRRRQNSLSSLPAVAGATPARMVAPLLPGSCLTGRPHLDAPPVGRAELAHALYYLVQLRDGRPGIVLAADRTHVWAAPRRVLRANANAPLPGGDRPSLVAAADATRVQLPHYDSHPYQLAEYGPSWWSRLGEALRPKAGFVLYSEDADNSAEGAEFRSHGRQGYVYDGLDVTQLKRAMDMSTEAWEHPEEAEKLINWLLRLSKNTVASITKVQDTFGAAKALKESLSEKPEVKAVVYAPLPASYSGYKTPVSQIDSMRQLPSPRAAVTGGAGFARVTNGTSSDSLWQEKYYDKNGKIVGRITARPPRKKW